MKTSFRGFRLTFIPLLVIIGPALITALPDATGGEARLSVSSLLLRRRPQICPFNITYTS